MSEKLTVAEQRLLVDCNIWINRAIEMLSEIPELKNSYLTAGYNGVVSLLQYAKESHEHAINKKKLNDE